MLNELFRRRDGRTLTCEAYRALGGMEGALANHAEATLAALPPKFRPRCRRCCARWSPPVKGTTSRSSRAACRWSPFRHPIRRRLLDVLIEARLLMTDRDDRMQPVVGIAHEALLTHWPRLKDLLEKDREFLRARTRVAPPPSAGGGRAATSISCSPRASRSPRPRPAQDPARRPRPRDDRIHRPLDPISDAPAPPPHARDRHDHRDRLDLVSAFAAFSFVEWRDALEQKQVAVAEARAKAQRKEAKEQAKKAIIARDEAGGSGTWPDSPPTSRT